MLICVSVRVCVFVANVLIVGFFTTRTCIFQFVQSHSRSIFYFEFIYYYFFVSFKSNSNKYILTVYRPSINSHGKSALVREK